MDHVVAWVEGRKVPRPDDERLKSVIERLLRERSTEPGQATRR